MAKRPVAAKKPEADRGQPLIDAIVTVRHLQDFIQEHGSLEQAQGAVARVLKLIELTGSFDQLKQALDIVGKEEKPEEAPAAQA
jgi:hypothetical protein